MRYTHEWINDGARYVIYNESGSVVESENDPTNSTFTAGKHWHLEKVQRQEERTIFKRYEESGNIDPDKTLDKKQQVMDKATKVARSLPQSASRGDLITALYEAGILSNHINGETV